MQKVLIIFLASFAIAFFIAPFVIRLFKKIGAGQEILHYVDFHSKKRGTPTMGGIIFILPTLILSPFFIRGLSTPFVLVALLAGIGYAFLGFLDDFIKVKTKNNLGLRAYQKAIGQGGLAVLVAIFYTMANPEGRILLPFFNIYFEIGLFIFPLTFLVLLATTNAVNLTDGLDGLAGTVSLTYFIFIGFIVYLAAGMINFSESTELLTLIASLCGGILAFLLFNTNGASVFMGDTGSLYLGAMIATISMFTFMGLFIIFLGVMFVFSALSVIIQVAYFKRTGGKRVFLMTPFHHHLEKKGYAEAKIVFIYVSITALIGLSLVVTWL